MVSKEDLKIPLFCVFHFGSMILNIKTRTDGGIIHVFAYFSIIEFEFPLIQPFPQIIKK